MKIAAMVNGGFALPTLRAIKDSRHELVALIAMPLRTRKKADMPPIREAARTFLADVPLYDPEDVNSHEGVALVRSLHVDLIFICDYGKILSREIISLTTYGGLNLHGSLLPKYRGAAPINRSILAGDREIGVSVIFIEPVVDAGPVVATASYLPSLEDTAVEIEDHLSKLGAPLVLRAIDEIEAGTIKPLPQSHEAATKAPKLRKEEGRIDWSKTCDSIINQYRAFQPWPRTYSDWLNSTSMKNVRLILGPFSKTDAQGVARVLSDKESLLVPGSVLSVSKGGIWIRTGDGALRVVEVQPAGKKKLPAEIFALGYPMKIGDVLN